MRENKLTPPQSIALIFFVITIITGTFGHLYSSIDQGSMIVCYVISIIMYILGLFVSLLKDN